MRLCYFPERGAALKPVLGDLPLPVWQVFDRQPQVVGMLHHGQQFLCLLQ